MVVKNYYSVVTIHKNVFLFGFSFKKRNLECFEC